ncbi:MAG: amidohydrolase family protein [Candidatus Poribacteria bacterium]|nr:amidohydrolase family protein [Candidatus Poribacteria bacterium]
MLRIIDTHQHLWDTSNLEYPWLDGFDLLRQQYTPQDYRDAICDINVVKSVHVEGDPAETHVVQEVEWLTQIAETDGMIGAIAAAAPLEKPNVDVILDQLAAFDLVVGIRRMAWHISDNNFYASRELINGVKLLEKYNLSFELCAKHDQLPAAIELVKATPNIIHAVNHCGGPNIKDREFEPWASHMRTIAGFDNVHCKVSGIVTLASENWTSEELKPYIRHLVDVFGFERLMFGSDWPVCTLAAEYHEWLSALLTVVDDASDSEKDQFFYQNALEFYKISV